MSKKKGKEFRLAHCAAPLLVELCGEAAANGVYFLFALQIAPLFGKNGDGPFGMFQTWLLRPDTMYWLVPFLSFIFVYPVLMRWYQKDLLSWKETGHAVLLNGHPEYGDSEQSEKEGNNGSNERSNLQDMNGAKSESPVLFAFSAVQTVLFFLAASVILNGGLTFLARVVPLGLDRTRAAAELLIGFAPWSVVLTTIVLAPLLEELLFRGLLFQRLREGLDFWTSAIASSLAFAVFHSGFGGFVYAVLFGFLFAIWYERNRSLLLVTLAHMTVNAFSFVLLFWKF